MLYDPPISEFSVIEVKVPANEVDDHLAVDHHAYAGADLAPLREVPDELVAHRCERGIAPATDRDVHAVSFSGRPT